MDRDLPELQTELRLALQERKAAMIEMRQSGMTLEEIGQAFGLTRQRVHQILSDVEELKELVGAGPSENNSPSSPPSCG